MSTYILKDPVYDSNVSRINNFFIQWSKWYPHVKMPPYDFEFNDEDIIIVNLYEGNPYGGYNIPDKCKKLFIVHRIDEKNIRYCKDADFIIYINDLLQTVVEDIGGIEKPCFTTPRHPMHKFITDVNQQNLVYIGGWFKENKTQGLLERLKYLHDKIPVEYEFGIFPIWGKVDRYKNEIDSFKEKLTKSTQSFGKRKIFIQEHELFYDLMLFKARIAKCAFLWENGPTREEIKDLIASKDKKILNYGIEESSMLAIFQSTKKEKLVVENRIKFIPAFEKKEVCTYQQFSQLIKKSIATIS